MIEKFNLFDVYTYLLPGVAFLGLIWLPFGIVFGSWPRADLSSALFSLAAAYIVGHVLYYPASEALPTEDIGTYPGGAPEWRATPSRQSDFILDAGESTYPTEFKKGLRDLINERFKGEVEVHFGLEWEKAAADKHGDESKQRGLAFFLCRSALVIGNAASYAQQFEGLYQFMRSLTVVFALGFFYHVGWALALWAPVAQCVTSVAGTLAALAIIGAAILTGWRDKVYDSRKSRMRARMTIGLLMLALLTCPFFLKWYVDAATAAGLRKGLLLAGIAFIDLFAGFRCSSGYKPFAKEFAKAIYRDFYVYAKTPDKAGTEAK